MIDIKFSEELTNNGANLLFLSESLELDNTQKMFDEQVGGLISHLIKDKVQFSGKFGQIKTLNYINPDKEFSYLIVVGTGKEGDIKENSLEQLGGKIVKQAAALKIKSLNLLLPAQIGNFSSGIAASLMAAGALLASHSFEKYFTGLKDEQKLQLKVMEFKVANASEAEQDFSTKKAVVTGVLLARNCVSEPANVLYPESYAEIIRSELEPLGVEMEILGEAQMKELGMGALLGVGQGSHQESKLVVMKYNGGAEENIQAAFVGKGVTFDTGGICLKPSAGMSDMKYDMAGSAAVVGAIKALALRKAKTNVVGVVGLVENMPGSRAQKPGDVVTTMSGKTAEVIDTDAEGRLVLADAIWYAQTKYNPKIVIDLATLTGAIVVALGNTFAGLFANNDELANKLIQSGDKVNEKLWRMPLHPDFEEMIKSDIADVANLGKLRGAAGSSTAAHFIKKFIKEGTSWAHIDMAGMAWEKKGSSICPKGAAGFGVRLLNQFIWDNYETR